MIKNLVSIVVPTYNDAPYLETALTDLLNQSYKEIEIIVVNDGSTDNTEEILKKFSSIKVINKKNGGTGSALNAGFAVAQGEFGTWVSSDDRKEKNMIEALVTFLKNNRDIEYVASSFYSHYMKSIWRAVLPNNNLTYGYELNYKGITSEEPTNKSLIIDDWVTLNTHQCHAGVNYMFTMRLKKECGDYLEIPGEDYYMTILMGLKTRVGYVDSILGSHNNPPDSLSMQDRNCVSAAVIKTRSLINSSYKEWKLKKIPKVAHFYWGSTKMSFLRYMTIKSFKKMNPDWSVYLYMPKDLNLGKTWNSHESLDNQEYEGLDYFEKLKEEIALKIIKVDFSKSNLSNKASEVHRSDYLRWNILSNSGGAWFDMDILFLKPLADSYLNTDEFSVLDNTVSYDGRHKKYDGTHQMSIGALLSSKNNIFYGTIFDAAKKLNDFSNYQSHGTLLLDKIGLLSNNYQENFRLTMHNLSSKSFYLKDYLHLEDVYEKNILDDLLKEEEFIGIHWYGGAPITKKYNNLINHETYKNFNSTITNGIKKILE